MNLYEACIPQLKKMLHNLERWLDAGAAFARSKNCDFSVLLASRLAPNQFPLLRQIQGACDHAKFAAARLTGREAPKHPDGDQPLDALRARIHDVVAYLDGFTPADFEGAETRKISLSFFEGKYFSGSEYLLEFLLPNFYFHITHAYAILRHNGVELGKRDFIGSLPLRED